MRDYSFFLFCRRMSKNCPKFCSNKVSNFNRLIGVIEALERGMNVTCPHMNDAFTHKMFLIPKFTSDWVKSNTAAKPTELQDI